jgi:hypothetical protein
MDMHAPREALSATERDRILWLASRQYMRGEISGEQLAEIESRYGPDLKKAVLTLAKLSKKRR